MNAPFVNTGLNRTYKRDKDGRFASTGMSASEFDAALAGAASGEKVLTAASLRREPNSAESVAIDRYGGEGGYVVNAELRTQAGHLSELSPRNRTTVEGLDSVMRSARLGEDVVVHRRVGSVQQVFGRDFKDDMTGLSWRDHAYVSTSVQHRGTYGSSRLQLRILARAGTSALSHPTLDPDEVVLGRGLTFTVVRDRGMESGMRQLDVLAQ
ncbi:MAG: ADP-ribosyltransferase [Micromonosporaceae bacterium]